PGVRGGEGDAAAAATKCFYGSGGIHVGDGSNAITLIVGQAGGDQLLPAVFHLTDFRHVSHGTAGVEIGQNNLLVGAAEHIGAFRHNMHAETPDVVAFGFGV